MRGGVRGMDWLSNAWQNYRGRLNQVQQDDAAMRQLVKDAAARREAATRGEPSQFQKSMRPFMTDDQIILETNQMLKDVKPSKAEQAFDDDDDQQLHSKLKAWSTVEMLRPEKKQSPAKSRWQKAKDRVLGQ
tara:strand:+ start:90 stop:485 length:396 start_codon:yes stop_codon:yes gene_type:complete